MFSIRSKGCGGRLVKPKDNDDSRHFKAKGKHSHAPDVRIMGRKVVMNTIKNRAKTTTESSRNIISDAMVGVQNAVAAVVPGASQLVQTVNRVRKDPQAPRNPKTVAELRFPEVYTKTRNNENFILFDSALSGEDYDDESFRIIMFGTEKNLDFLVGCSEIYMDGTFWVTPSLFSQLYTLHGKIYILSKKIYDRFLICLNIYDL